MIPSYQLVESLLFPIFFRPCLQDHEGGKLLLVPLQGRFPRLKLIWVDSAYKKGDFVEWVKAEFGWEVEAVEHPWSGLRGVLAPKRRSSIGRRPAPEAFTSSNGAGWSNGHLRGFPLGADSPRTMKCCRPVKRRGSMWR